MSEEDKDIKVLAIKKYVPARWTSFFECIDRILEMEKPLREYFQKKKPQSKKNLLLDSDNILHLRLMHRLMSGLIEQIVFFEKDDLSSVEVVNGLRKCFIQSGEHLFSIKRESLSTSVFPNISQYLNLDKEDPIYIAAKRTSIDFEQFFLQENKRFKEMLNGKSGEFRTKFFEIARTFFENSFEDLKKRLPKFDAMIMKGDCVVLKDMKDLENMRFMADTFRNLYNEFDFYLLENQIDRIKNETEFIQKLQNRENIIEQWKTMESKYPQLFRLIQIIQLVPYSNSNVERDFSQLNLIKTTRRNRLHVKNIEACLLIKQEDSNFIESLYTKSLLKKSQSRDNEDHSVIKSPSTSQSMFKSSLNLAEKEIEEEKKEEEKKQEEEEGKKEEGLTLRLTRNESNSEEKNLKRRYPFSPPHDRQIKKSKETFQEASVKSEDSSLINLRSDSDYNELIEREKGKKSVKKKVQVPKKLSRKSESNSKTRSVQEKKKSSSKSRSQTREAGNKKASKKATKSRKKEKFIDSCLLIYKIMKLNDRNFIKDYGISD